MQHELSCPHYLVFLSPTGFLECIKSNKLCGDCNKKFKLIVLRVKTLEFIFYFMNKTLKKILSGNSLTLFLSKAQGMPINFTHNEI